MGQFENKVALITGGATGMGRATAIEFAKNGAKVVIADVADAKETVDAITSAGGEAIYVKTDVSKSADVKALVEKTVSTYGSLDYAFNNAGIELGGKLTADVDEEEFDKVISINLKGVWLGLKYEIPQMLKQGKGVIVNTSSTAGITGVPSLSAYTASKHGIIGLTQVAAIDYGKQGIRVNAVIPGPIKTPMLEGTMGNSKTAKDKIESALVMGRIGEPQEIANAVIFLCSDGASYVNGTALAVDGGWLAK